MANVIQSGVALAFTGADQLVEKLGSIGGAMTKFADKVSGGSEKVRELGGRMVEWGEKIGVVTAVLSEGANTLHEWSDRLSEPAYAMERSMATMAAMTGLASDQLAEIKEHAIEFSDAHAGAGTLGRAYQTATANAADQIALLRQNVSNLYEATYFVLGTGL